MFTNLSFIFAVSFPRVSAPALIAYTGKHNDAVEGDLMSVKYCRRVRPGRNCCCLWRVNITRSSSSSICCRLLPILRARLVMEAIGNLYCAALTATGACAQRRPAAINTSKVLPLSTDIDTILRPPMMVIVIMGSALVWRSGKQLRYRYKEFHIMGTCQAACNVTVRG